MLKSKNFKTYNQALAITFQAKKNLGQFSFSVGGKLRCREGNQKECKIWSKVPRNGRKLLGMDFLDIFRAQNDCLVVGYLMGKEIFEFWPNLCPWQLFKEVNRQGILADFAKSAKTLRHHILG